MSALKMRTFFICSIFVLFGSITHGQSTPALQPPSQTYVYEFTSTASAKAPVVPALNLGASFSFEFWMKLNPYALPNQLSVPVFHKDIPNSGADPFFAYNLSLSPANQLLYYQSTGSPGSDRGVSQFGPALTPGQWHHIAIVSSNLQVTLYLNGLQQAQFTAAGPPPINSLPLQLGGSQIFLRQFRIWGRALSPVEIQSSATTQLTGSESGLIVDWPLDDGQGVAPRDIGPNHLPLQLVKGTAYFTYLFPIWARTEIVDGGPYFQVQRLAVPPATITAPAVYTIPIDFNSDGNIDLLSCQTGVSPPLPCAAFRNDGKGNFTDLTTQVLGPNPPKFETARDYCVADFNGDGRADVFIANTGEGGGTDLLANNGGQSALLIQTPDGKLEDRTAAAGLPQQRIFTHNVACGDIDGNGTVEIYLANQNSPAGAYRGGPQIWLNDGQGHFSLGDPARLPAILYSGNGNYPTGKFIDVNNSGHLDLYVGSNGTENQPKDLLLLNDGHGFFTVAPDNALPARYGGRDWGTVSMRVVDFDGDGWPDLINTVFGLNYCEGAVQILLNDHDGTFRDATNLFQQPAWARHGSLFSDGNVYVDPVYAADFNGDGSMDLLVQGVNQPSRLFLNTGPSGGSRLVEVTESLPASGELFAVADFNNDGLPDIAAFIQNCCGSPLPLETWLTRRPFLVPPDLIPPLAAGPFFLRGSVFNSASFSANALAPGEFITIFGSNLGPATFAVASPADGTFPRQLSGTRVLFNNVAAPIIYTSAGAVITVVPFSVVPGTFANVVVEYQGSQSPAVPIFVASSAPGLFTSNSSGAGPAAVLNVDSATGAVSLNTTENPASPGGLVVAYITGAGQTSPPSQDGVVATSGGGMALPIAAGLNFLLAAYGSGPTDCASNAGCRPVEVLDAGPAPGIVAGVTQVNMRLPSPLPSGTYNLGISAGGIWSQWLVSISIR